MWFERVDLRGSRILITGASSGIGRALAGALAERGARLVLSARSEPRLRELRARIVAGRSGVAHVVRADVAEGSDRRRLVDHAVASMGGLDVLVNNAGIGASGWFREASEKRLRRIFEVNFFSATELTRLALPHLERGRDPMVVNVSSVIGRRGVPGYSEYCASKFALSGWTESIRPEFRARGVHVLLVTPGRIATPFQANLIERGLAEGPPGRGMSAERCAGKIVRAMVLRRGEVVITWPGRVLVFLNRVAPRFVDRVMVAHVGRMAE